MNLRALHDQYLHFSDSSPSTGHYTKYFTLNSAIQMLSRNLAKQSVYLQPKNVAHRFNMIKALPAQASLEKMDAISF